MMNFVEMLIYLSSGCNELYIMQENGSDFDTISPTLLFFPKSDNNRIMLLNCIPFKYQNESFRSKNFLFARKCLCVH